MKMNRLGSLLFIVALGGLVGCSDDGGGGGDDSDDGTADDGADGGDGTDDGDDGGTEPDAGEPTGDGSSTDCLSAEFAVANEGWMHVPESAGIVYANEPPASGNHYAVWATWGAHGELARGYWIHNVEHQGIVLLRSPDASDEVVAGLTAAFEAIPDDPDCGHPRTVLATDVGLTTPVAVIAADVAMEGDCADQDAILAFVEAHRGPVGTGPENLCDEGTIE